MTAAQDLYPTPCPVCSCNLPQAFEMRNRNGAMLTCANCGQHRLTGEAFEDLKDGRIAGDRKARMAFGVRKVPTSGELTSELLRQLADTSTLPQAMERIDNLVLYLAKEFAPGATSELVPEMLQARIGTASKHESRWVIDQALRLNLIQGVPTDAATARGEWRLLLAALTVEGFKRHAELMRNGAGSRHAFMAMDFNDAELGEFFTQHLQPAVKQTDFELRTTDHAGKTAGLIDNRMRVELHTSRFVLCDLTHGNRGAYWEAGFAEGLGRPVIYLCRHEVLADRAHKDHPHFDAAHQAIVAWNPADPGPGLAELKAMIRATLPAEARMEDPPPGGSA